MFENQFNNKCHFLLAEDYNARVGKKPDYVENESLLDLNLLQGPGCWKAC